MCCKNAKDKYVFVSGILFILFGFFLLFFGEEAQERIATKKFKLSQTSKTYEPWVESKVPIYVQYYFFNWTNPTNLQDENYKPNLTQVGPYKFWEKIEKVNITWNENGTVSYRRIRRWYFDPEGSSGSLDDRVTTINVIALMAANMVKPMPSLGRIAMSMMIAGTQKISVTKTVSEFLFEGYVDPLLTAGRGWPTTSSKVPYDRFGWFYKRNGSSTFDGIYNVQTGANGMEHFGVVAQWNFKNETKFYEGKCGQVRGSGGEYWPWKRKKDTDVYLFSPDLCRYIRYKFAEEVRISEIDGFKYVADSNLFDNGTFEPGNKCFCNGQCLPSGVLNISMCRYGAPVFTSYPHFYQADPIYLSAINGMKPNRSLHENFIALEPTYGIPLKIAARIQINVLVKPSRYVTLLDGVQEIIFPVLWLDQRVSVPAERLTEIKLLLHLPKAILALSIVFLILGTICFSVFAFYKAGQQRRMVTINKEKIESKNSGKIGYSLRKNEPQVPDKKWPSYPTIKSLQTLETDF